MTLRMFAEVDHPGLGLLMDPTNYFEAHNIDAMDETLGRVFDALDDRILIAHAKDVKRSGDDKAEKHADIDASESHTFRGVGEIELPAPGLGALNYDLYLERLARRPPQHSNHHRTSGGGGHPAREGVPRRQAAGRRGL